MSNFRSNFHTELAQLFYYDLLYRRSNYYYFIGKVDPWTGTNDFPPAILPVDSQEQNDIIRSNMVFAKRISPAEASLACKNWRWSLGLIFDQWDHTQDMKDKMFFCVTSDYRVYKCLDNANGIESTIEPTGTSIAPVRLEDGYLWKYMYTIPTFKRSRFVTATHIPVQRALTDNFFNRGELEGAVVINQGSGYSDSAPTTIVVNDTGKTTGSGATGTVVVGGPINTIQSITITNAGTGYTKGVKVDLASTTGSNAVLRPIIKFTATFSSTTGLAVDDILLLGTETYEYKVTSISGTTVQFKQWTATVPEVVVPTTGVFSKKGAPATTFTCTAITNGVIDSVEVVQGGLGYTGATITFRVGGAVVVPKVDSTGSIVGVKILDKGYGYSAAPTLTPNAITGTGAYGNASALLTGIAFRGLLETVNITDPGVGYPFGTSTIVQVQGDGTGAAITPVIYQGKLIDVILENPGSGYTFTIITVTDTGGFGVGAEVRSIIEGNDYESDQSIIEQTAVPGAIYSIGIGDGGNGYSTSTTITIVGDGTGATATCVVSNGEIVQTVMTNFGSGYSYANVVLSNTGSGSGAELYAVMPPPGGHGVDAPTELFGDVVVLNSNLRNEPLNAVVTQDYRQFGILKNPRDQFNVANFINETSLVLYKVTFDNTDDLTKDDVLAQGTSRFIVVEKSGTTVYLSKLNSFGTLLTGAANTLINVEDSNLSYVCTAVLSSPSMNKYSGSLLYMSNEGAFSFTETQGLIIKTLIRF